jgi:antitoxin component YwqK of YwqJK toxin-antitoxin module
MRRLLVILPLLISLSSFSQSTLPDNFNIGNYIQVFSKDSLKIYFNCTGTVVEKKFASYYRVGKMDSSIINVNGEFNDYYVSGALYLKATMLNNMLEGYASYYYPNGILKEAGGYTHNTRDGIWKYYYSNGKLEKVLDFIDGRPLVKEAYTKRGNATVLGGNGNISTEIRTYKQCVYFNVSGDVLNGERNGKWQISNPGASTPFGTENFENGKFIKGNLPYDSARIVLTVYTPNEELNLTENYLMNLGATLSNWTYKDDPLYKVFYPELQTALAKYKSVLKDQWLVVGLTISKKNKLSQINVASSIDEKELEQYVFNTISKMTEWETARVNSSKIESTIFFSILVTEGQVIIPAQYSLDTQ